MKQPVHLRALVILIIILVGAYALLRLSKDAKEGFWEWRRRRRRRHHHYHPRSPYPYGWSVWPYGGWSSDGYYTY